jgi:H+/Cl- antiporter ClcA
MPTHKSRSITEFMWLGFYAGIYAHMIVWHVQRSGSMEPLQSLGILLLALCCGLCWVAVTRILPRISEKIAIHRRWVANLVKVALLMSLSSASAARMATEDLGLVEVVFGLDGGSQGAAAAPPRLGLPLLLGLLVGKVLLALKGKQNHEWNQ